MIPGETIMVYSITREMRNGQTYVGRSEDAPATFVRPGPGPSLVWARFDPDPIERLARLSAPAALPQASPARQKH